MKSSFSIRCNCGKEMGFAAIGTQLFKGTDCPECHARIEIIDNGIVSGRVFNRSWSELQSEDFTLAIILGAMAMECELARLYVKWKNIESVEPGTFATKEQEDSWEKELRRASKIVERLDLVSRFLTGDDFDIFFSNRADLMKALHARHPESVGKPSPKKFFEENLFHKRNRIVHLGKIDYTQGEAEACHRSAATLLQALGEMDLVRFKKLEASFHHR
jgi:hypothetical protein